MTFVCNYKLIAFIFQTLLWQEWRVKLLKNVVSVFSVFLRFFLHLVELESSYKQYNKLYESIKYPAMFFLYTISFNLQWLDCSL